MKKKIKLSIQNLNKKEMFGNSICVGIDLGTTFSSFCYYNPENEQEVIIQSDRMESKIPSVVSMKMIIFSFPYIVESNVDFPCSN